jgi:hypothetical protein
MEVHNCGKYSNALHTYIHKSVFEKKNNVSARTEITYVEGRQRLYLAVELISQHLQVKSKMIKIREIKEFSIL